MIDERNVLRDEKPFSYKLLKDGKAQVFFRGRLVSTFVGKQYDKLAKLAQRAGGSDGADSEACFEVQLFLAKNTGNFRHGNE